MPYLPKNVRWCGDDKRIAAVLDPEDVDTDALIEAIADRVVQKLMISVARWGDECSMAVGPKFTPKEEG